MASPPPGTNPPGFSNSLGPTAILRIDGREVPFGNVLAQRLPNSDTTRFTLVSSADVTCEKLPLPSESTFIAAVVVSRFFSAEADGRPSKRPLSVSAATFKVDGDKSASVAGQSFGPLLEPFVEPTTMTLMFGRVDVTLPLDHIELKGTLMAQVCLPATNAEAIENLQPQLELSYVGSKMRVRGAVMAVGSAGTDELRISGTPLTCDDLTQGDREVRIGIDKKSGAATPPRVVGVAADDSARAKASFSGASRVNKSANGDLQIDVKGTFSGRALELVGTVSPRKCR